MDDSGAFSLFVLLIFMDIFLDFWQLFFHSDSDPSISVLAWFHDPELIFMLLVLLDKGKPFFIFILLHMEGEGDDVERILTFGFEVFL